MTKIIGGMAGAMPAAGAQAAVSPPGAEAEAKLAAAKYAGENQGFKPYPENVLLPFEFSPDVEKAVKGGQYEFIHQLNLADKRVDDARKLLAGIKQSDVPKTVEDMKLSENAGIADAMRGAHFAVSNSREGRAHFHVDGSMFEADASNPKIVKEQSVEDFLNTVVYRLKGSDTQAADMASVDTAIMKAQDFGKILTYKDSPVGHPDVDQANKLLDEVHQLIQSGLNNAGTNSKDASKWTQMMNHLQQLTPGQSRAVLIGSIAGAVLVGGTIGVLLAKN